MHSGIFQYTQLLYSGIYANVSQRYTNIPPHFQVFWNFSYYYHQETTPIVNKVFRILKR